MFKPKAQNKIKLSMLNTFILKQWCIPTMTVSDLISANVRLDINSRTPSTLNSKEFSIIYR